MTDDLTDIRRGFLAERRSLIITGFVLFLYQRAGLKFDEISIFGNKASLSDPWWIECAIWVLLGYFGLRYLQYFMSIPNKGFAPAYEHWMMRIIRRSAFKRFKRSFIPDEKHAGLKPDFQLKEKETTFPFTYPKLWSVKLAISVAYQLTDGGAAAASAEYKEDVESVQLLWAKVKAISCVLILTPVGTEYFLPFLIALLPVGNLLWR